MNENATPVRELTVELPADAPLIRITAGFGSAGQKTWNLRRPVTLIGNRRPAHIVLHDQDISSAHCVIVNTGTEVLLRDLHSSGGTFCNQTRVDLAALKDGDVITLGSTNIQVAIQVPADAAGDSGCGLEYVEPTKFPCRVEVNLIHTDTHWLVEDAVVLIGRHNDATIRLDHPDLSSRHAVLFRSGSGPAIFDLGSRNGLWVNGQRCSLTPLSDGDRVTVGPFGLGIRVKEHATGLLGAISAGLPSTESKPVEPVIGAAAAALASTPLASTSSGSARSLPEPVPHDPLHHTLSEAWERLNSSRTSPRADTPVLDEQQSSLSAREAELDARDAALRGQLHDITRFHEQVMAREQELAAQLAQLQAEKDVLATAQKTFAERELELSQRDEDLTRREHVLSQRWSRLLATTCPRCGQPVNVGQVSATEGG